MSGELLITERDNGVVVLQLNRPTARNALSISLRDQISDGIDLLVARADVRALVITGVGQTFCSGFDLKEFTAAANDPGLTARLWASSDRFHHTVLRCAVPVICALNGPALAGGFDLATLCDLRVAQDGVWFARPEIDWALPLYLPLRDLVGGAIARELCFTNRRVELEEALRIGLVTSVAEDALTEALELADQIAARPPEAVRATKAKIVAAAGISARPTLAL
jgi:enoyl-CoA hydratase/carnithine racemase